MIAYTWPECGVIGLLAIGSIFYTYTLVRVICLAIHRSAAERQKDKRSNQ